MLGTLLSLLQTACLYCHGFMRNLQLSVPCQMLMGVLEIRESKGMQTFSTIWYKLFPAFVHKRSLNELRVCTPNVRVRRPNVGVHKPNVSVRRPNSDRNQRLDSERECSQTKRECSQTELSVWTPNVNFCGLNLVFGLPTGVFSDRTRCLDSDCECSQTELSFYTTNVSVHRPNVSVHRSNLVFADQT